MLNVKWLIISVQNVEIHYGKAIIKMDILAEFRKGYRRVALNSDTFGQKIIRETQRVNQRASARKQGGGIDFKNVKKTRLYFR